MANNPYSVAGSVLNDYPMQIDEFQDAAEHITGQAFQSDNRYEIFPFSYRMEAIMKHARGMPRSFMPRPWEQSMCSSLF